ncbi:uncharacterized protein BDZ99DRAFT_457140 [Mytilinidion resinicola]|uniref:Uncharacterized protein n=1 Tax=Mytilinidion resinicola TaxID=574789 RepID=A0A6A6Z9J1_9PEZI|nr:uncharacterized protein BDZ99DRAFT_457140 [Mytilinidion resinicola]KAF2817403.1 hypothetical protein BDZ99DRAFT_457140 [Mytilinidion resinicola]
MPDINSLPPPRSTSASPLQTRMAQTIPSSDGAPRPATPPTSHSPPRSLVAAAAMNAGMQNEESRRPSGSPMRREVERARRRSSVRLVVQREDPTLPSPGELQPMSPSTRTRAPGFPPSPHHERAPSLGELHQELESEQEGQVNRLLNMIRQEHHALSNQRTSHALPSHSSSAVIDDGPPQPTRSPSLPRSGYASQQNMSHPQASPLIPRSRSPLPAYNSPSRQSSLHNQSQSSSHAGSPAIRPVSAALGSQNESSEFLLGTPANARDESAFYQAETQTLTRENQMLKLRIRELERQMAELNPTSPIAHTPVVTSHLGRTPSFSGEPRQVDDTKIEGREWST